MRKAIGIGTLVALTGCGAAGSETSTARQDLRIEVDISERELYVFIGDERVNTYPVAVGQPEYPTPTGDFSITQVDWNPDWTPPDAEWAEGEEYRAPGEPGNPMGRARIIFSPPYTIHGTEDLASLGTAASHGSIRLSNENVINLARRVMEHGGASRPDAWYRETLADPTEMRQVRIPNPIPIRIRE